MKSLSEKNIKQKYIKAGISKEEKELLNHYMLCFSNLYGSIQINDLWLIFKQYNEKIKKEKFFDFIDISQREENDFLILNLNEAYTGETSEKTKDKLLVNKSLVGKFSGKYWHLHRLEEFKDYQYGPYIPDKEELFHYDHDLFYESCEGQQLINFLSQLKATGYEYDKFKEEKNELLDINGKTIKGKCFKDIVCYSNWEKFEINYCKRENEKEYLRNKANITCLQKILNEIKFDILIESGERFMDSMKKITGRILNDFGAEMSEDDINKFLGLYANLVNVANRWCLFGWSSMNLRKNIPNSEGPIELQIGPNMRKMIDNGEYEIKELEKAIQDKKLNVVISNNIKDNYSEDELIKENEKYLRMFSKFLEKRNYRENTLEEHLSRVDYYINNYLMCGLPKPMQEGCSLEIYGFITNKVNEDVIPASVHNIDLFLASITLFYECMLENKAISKEAYLTFKEDIKSVKDELVEDYYEKNPKLIELYDVIETIEIAHGYGTGYMNIKTGDREFVFEDESLYNGDLDELYDKLDSQYWQSVPEINDYQIMMSFSLGLKNTKQSNRLINILHNKKSYKNFKDALYEMGLEDKYYDFYEMNVEELARTWMIENGLNDSDYDDEVSFENLN